MTIANGRAAPQLSGDQLAIGAGGDDAPVLFLSIEILQAIVIRFFCFRYFFFGRP